MRSWRIIIGKDELMDTAKGKKILLLTTWALIACTEPLSHPTDAGPDTGKADPDREIGRCCTGPEGCTTNRCIAVPLAGKIMICSKLCHTNQDCPPRSGCQRLGDGKGGFYSGCVPCELVANTNPRSCPMEAGIFSCWW